MIKKFKINRFFLIAFFVIIVGCSSGSYSISESTNSQIVEVAQSFVEKIHPESLQNLEREAIILDKGCFWIVRFDPVANDVLAGSPTVFISKETMKIVHYYHS